MPVETHGSEISRLAATMNGMLDRLENSQEAQRRFTSDAAHELRTPLASMRAQLDVDLAHPQTADWPATAGRVRTDVERMQRLVEDLLRLARSGGGATPAMDRLVDLDDVVLSEVASVSRRPGVELDSSAVSAASVRGSADDLRRLVSNLLSNAMRHAESAVAVSVHEEADHSVLRVDDDGSGVGEEYCEAIFERFVRLDEARSRDSGGSGLGLALSREIAESHGGTLHVESNASGGASFVLRLPSGS